MAFPDTIETFTTLVDNVDTVLAQHPNDRGAAITRIMTALGTNLNNVHHANTFAGQSLNLECKNSSDSKEFTITADELVVKDDTNTTAKRIESVSVTIDIESAVGINALDEGSEAADTWYYGYVIRKPSDGSVAGLMSTSSTAPTLPTGYTEKALVTAVRNDASSDFIDFRQNGCRWSYVKGQEFQSGSVGGSWLAVDMSGFVPSSLSNYFWGSSHNSGQSWSVSPNNTDTAGGQSAETGYGTGVGVSTSDNGRQGYEFLMNVDDTIYCTGGGVIKRIYGFHINKIPV